MVQFPETPTENILLWLQNLSTIKLKNTRKPSEFVAAV
jgi:hypothetical protein